MVTGTIKIHSKEEVQSMIESLKEKGSTAFFYLNGSPSEGGPLGRGAAIVELNPAYPEKKHKKYNIYTADVKEMEPDYSNKKYLFNSDKAADIAKWIKERHFMPSRP